MHRVLGWTLAVLLIATGAAAQETTTGSITGRVTDPQGLPLPGVTVTITSPQGERAYVTDAQGQFFAPALTPGVYEARAELTGFGTVQQRNIEVRLGQRAELSLRMQLGAVTETVEVTGTTAVVDTSNTTVGANIDSEMLARIPVQRQLSDTLYLAPGVSSGGGSGRANPSMSGASGLENQYLVDGVNVTNPGYGALGWQSAHLKARHPAEWAAGILNHHAGMYATWVHVEDLRRRGVAFGAPCVQRSAWETTLEVDEALRRGSVSCGTLARQTPWKPSQPPMKSHLSSCDLPSLR